MKDERGVSQVLFGFLPMQTADLQGRVWRVVRWTDPVHLKVDPQSVRAALASAVYRWEVAGKDDGVGAEIARRAEFDVIGVDVDRGVLVEEFPRVWRCSKCGRVTRTADKCKCGGTRKTQLSLVSYHSCGRVEEPTIPRCKVHGEAALERSGTTRLSEQKFFCPVCDKVIKWGFVPRGCGCGGGPLRTNQHRAASVYTPHFAVVVNPPDPGAASTIRASGGGARALEWALDGAKSDTPFAGQQTEAGLVDAMMRQGISEATAIELARAAAAKGEVQVASATATPVPPGISDRAQEEALSLATAVDSGRTTVESLISTASPALKSRYEAGYRGALAKAWLEGVDFLPSFPVLTFAFGYTRDQYGPDFAQLQAFRDRAGRLQLHGSVGRTEALLFRVNPMRVERQFIRAGLLPEPPSSSPRDARLAILGQLSGTDPTDSSLPAGDELLYALLHSYAHRAIRRLAAFAGIERDSLAEYLLPTQNAFIVYTAARGDFVLGGLQAVFETSLDQFLEDVVSGEWRCPLDPACSTGGGACMACLHLGEPSCRWYNLRLSRQALFGVRGFFT